MTPTSPPSYDFLDEHYNFISNVVRSSQLSKTSTSPTSVQNTIPTSSHDFLDEPTSNDSTVSPLLAQQDIPSQNINTTHQPTNPNELPQSAQNHSPNVSQPEILNPPENLNLVSTHPMVTCFRVRTNCPTQRLTLHMSSISPLPKSYVDAFNDLNWQNAMNDEYNAILKNNTRTLVPRPAKANVVQYVKNAFLYEDLSETVYMHQPLGFRDSAYPDYVCLLQRFLYGLK
ncbi:ribonuclease H-like domain-containing protein [Tanacetum coccineum]